MKHVIERSVQKEVFRDVVVNETKTRMPDEMRDVVGAPGDQVVHDHDVDTFSEQTVAQMRTQKSRPAGNQRARHRSYPFARTDMHDARFAASAAAPLSIADPSDRRQR